MNRLQELRMKKGCSQADVARFLNVTQQAYSRYERGDHELGYTAIIKLADFFQVSIDYLLGRSDNLGAVSIQSGAPEITPEEKELVQLYRSLSPQFRKMAIDMLHLWEQQTAAENGSKKHA